MSYASDLRSWCRRTLWLAVFGALLCCDVTANAAATNALARCISLSGQIHVYTADPTMGPMLATFCEDVRERFRKRIGDTSPWRAPIAIIVRQRPSTAPVPMPGDEAPLHTSVVSVSGFLRFQIELEPPPPVDAARFVHALAIVLCAEFANRNTGKVLPGQPLARAPLWLVEGLINGLDPDAREETLRLVRDAMSKGKIPGFKTLVDADGPAAAGVDAKTYAAISNILVGGFEAQPDGKQKLQRFLSSLRQDQPWQKALVAAFGPTFDTSVAGTATTLEKWWSLVTLRAANLIVPQAQSAPETRRQFELALLAADPKIGPCLAKGELDEEAKKRFFDKPKDFPKLVMDAEARLRVLAALAHPLYRPAIVSYLDATKILRQPEPTVVGWVDAFNLWRKGQLNDFQTALKKASDLRRKADGQTDEISRYVGSVEASMFPEDVVSKFSDYFQAPRPAEKSTPVRDYLDRVESSMKD